MAKAMGAVAQRGKGKAATKAQPVRSKGAIKGALKLPSKAAGTPAKGNAKARDSALHASSGGPKGKGPARSPAGPPKAFARADMSSEFLPPRPFQSQAQSWAQQARASQLLTKLEQSGIKRSAERPRHEKRFKAVEPATIGSIKTAKLLRKAKGETLGQLQAMPPAAQARYADLPKADRKQVDKVYRAISGEAGPAAEVALIAMDTLLADGKLSRKDANGKTLLHTLSERVGKALAPPLAQAGVSPAAQLGDIVTAMAFPGTIFQGKNTATCVAASIETVLCKTDPAEFARLATGLLWDGGVQLKGGAVVKLTGSEAGKDDSGRTLAHQLIQGSLRDFAAELPEEGAGSPQGEFGGGRYTARRTFGEGKLATGATVPASRTPAPGPTTEGKGLTAPQASTLYEQAVGVKSVPFSVNDSNREAAVGMLKEALVRQGAVSVGVRGIDDAGNPTVHQVTVDRIEGDMVILHDSGQGEAVNVPIADFKQDLETITVMTSFIQQASHARDERRAERAERESDDWFIPMMRGGRIRRVKRKKKRYEYFRFF